MNETETSVNREQRPDDAKTPATQAEEEQDRQVRDGTENAG